MIKSHNELWLINVWKVWIVPWSSNCQLFQIHSCELLVCDLSTCAKSLSQGNSDASEEAEPTWA